MSKSGLNMSIIFLYLLLILQFFSRISAIRKDTGFLEKRFCSNTVQGRYLLSDDNGRVCDALSVDPISRCCPEKGDKFSCHGCNLLSQCCNSYEYCVSCCLNPLKMLKQHILKMKIAKPATAGTYASVFDFCAGRCRHNSESVNLLRDIVGDSSKVSSRRGPYFGAPSVFPYDCKLIRKVSFETYDNRVHENAYISEFHHCFSVPSNSSGENSTYLEARLNGINIVVGRQGESCDSVCKSNGQSCVPNKLPVLNQCDIMQKYMRCEGDCLASIGADQPAEVVDSAPKHLNPGACLYTRTQSILSCDGSHQHTRRLCPCA